MLDHLVLWVADYEKSKAFYSQALAPLAMTLVAEYGSFGGFGLGRPSFWIGAGRGEFWRPESRVGAAPVHVAFRAATRAVVDAFHEAALAAGGTSNGAPGLRALYHPDYYGAFVLDPDGNNIEAVCHDPASDAAH